MRRRDRISNEDTATETEQDGIRLSFVQKLVTNWLITDPNLYKPNLHNKEKVKNYQVQKHDNVKFIYFFGGRLRTAKQKPINIITGVLILIPGVLFWIFEAKWIWKHINPSIVILFSYFWVITVSFFVKASASDAGILPRNMHVPFSINPVSHSSKVLPPDEYFNVISLPHKVNDYSGVEVKYCATCHIWRPPRTSHCSTCNSCIVNHDHHCVFLNNCIGYRNYKYFLWFLLFSVIEIIILITVSFVNIFHYRMVKSSTILTFRSSISKYPVSFLLALYGFLALSYLLALLLFHIFLTSYNITTREYLNNIYGIKRLQITFTNHYNTHSILKNLYINWLGKPRGFSLVRPTDTYQVGDLRFEKLDPLQSFTSN